VTEEARRSACGGSREAARKTVGETAISRWAAWVAARDLANRRQFRARLRHHCVKGAEQASKSSREVMPTFYLVDALEFRRSKELKRIERRVVERVQKEC
jgi:hypothetical protein